MTWLLKVSVAGRTGKHTCVMPKRPIDTQHYKHHKRKESLVLGLKHQDTSDCQLAFNLSCTVEPRWRNKSESEKAFWNSWDLDLLQV